MFLAGEAADELKYQCDYVLDRKNDDLMFRYLRYPSATVEEAATHYWQEHQDDILLELRKNEIIREKYRAIEAQKNNPLHKQRAIMAAVKESGAKTVNGLGMLARQGALNFKLWTGVDAPQELMMETLKKEFGL